MQWEEALNSFKAKLAGGSDVFGPLIHRFLLDNPHRISVVMLPDSALAAKTEEGEKARLEAIRAQLSEQEVRLVRSCGVRARVCVRVVSLFSAAHYIRPRDSSSSLFAVGWACWLGAGLQMSGEAACAVTGSDTC